MIITINNKPSILLNVFKPIESKLKKLNNCLDEIDNELSPIVRNANYLVDFVYNNNEYRILITEENYDYGIIKKKPIKAIIGKQNFKHNSFYFPQHVVDEFFIKLK